MFVICSTAESQTTIPHDIQAVYDRSWYLFVASIFRVCWKWYLLTVWL